MKRATSYRPRNDSVKPRVKEPTVRAPKKEVSFRYPPAPSGGRKEKEKNVNSEKISVVVPAYNEKASLEELAAGVSSVMESLGRPWELVIVDDGSTDGTAEALRELSRRDPRVRIVFLSAHQGKAAALAAGFKAAEGGTIVTLDADLQDDPEDIPRFLEKLEEGFDLVCGWKRPRRDPLGRRVASSLFNSTVSLLLGPRLHDHNCGFKAYRREVVREIALYGDLHRFATFLAHARGFRVCEIPVKHRPRKYGKSRYGVERIWRGVLDLFTVTLLTRGSRRVFELFARVGIPLSAVGLLLSLALLPFSAAASFRHVPLFLAGILLFLIGVQTVAAGLLCELILSAKERSTEKRKRPEKEESGAPSVVACGEDEELRGRIREEIERLRAQGSLGKENGERVLVVESGGEKEIEKLLSFEKNEKAVLLAPSQRACLCDADTLAAFPGTPRSVRELALWALASGREVLSLQEEGKTRNYRIGILTAVRYLPLVFLGRYRSRPLHFFGSAGILLVASGTLAGVIVKASRLGGHLRYFLMELALGFAVAGVELFLVGLLGELLVYVTRPESGGKTGT